MKKKILIVYIFVLIVSLFFITGCALELLEIGGLEAGEAAVGLEAGEAMAGIETGEAVAGIEASEASAGFAAEDISLIEAEEESILGEVMTEEGSINTTLADVRVRESFGENPRLYIKTKYGTKDIAEIIDNRTLKVLDKGIKKTVPGEFFKVKGDVIKVRSTRIIDPNDYNLKYKIHEDEIVLVLSEREGWYTVWLGENKVGYVKANKGLLAPIIAYSAFSNNPNHHPVYKTCIDCNGVGTVLKNINCPSCNGNGVLNCYSCNGQGSISCYSCGGKGFNDCFTCGGRGYNDCFTCGGRGFTNCYTCSGSGRMRDRFGNIRPCYRCRGYGKFLCKRCRGNGKIVCNRCDGKKIITCSRCNGQGKYNCSNCNGSGKRKCGRCNGNKTFQVKYLCSSCKGSGQIDTANF